MRTIAQQKLTDTLASIDPEEFTFKDVEFCGEDAVLVNPALQGTKWTQVNKYLRSIIYRKSDYKILSSGFCKFVNYSENPDNFPPPNDLVDSFILNKEDGSLMIVDFVNSQLNIRTRGTSSYITLENSKDFEVALKKYQLIEPWLKNHDHFSLLFEIVTPNQRIVLDYPEIDLFLIGVMNKETLELVSQKVLDCYSMEMCVPRPKYYHFDTLSELMTTIKDAEGIEGCCLYKGGDIWKIKSLQYLRLHQFKSNATFKNLLELYSEQDFPNFKTFKKFILDQFDWECWQMVEEIVENICESKKVVDKEITDVTVFVNENKNLTDKEFAIKVKDEQWKSLAFSIRKGKALQDKTIKNLIKRKYENSTTEV